jgi:hypothetical protein|tara:strand:+ start:443 stop:868 length:426 start_codon:yes stop_codon:yes gene_type:complete
MAESKEPAPKRKNPNKPNRNLAMGLANLAGQTLGPAMKIGRRGITQLSDMIGNKDSNKANLKALRSRGLGKNRRDFLNVLKSVQDTKTAGRLNLSDVKKAMKKADSLKGKDASKKAKKARGLNTGGVAGRLAKRGYGIAKK